MNRYVLKIIALVSIVILFFTLLVFLRVDVKNKVRIESGTYRILSYDLNEDSIITIRPYLKGDTNLGIGISFKIDFYSDGSQKTSLINMHRQGQLGVDDTIKSMNFFCGKTDVSSSLVNTISKKLFYIDDLIQGKPYVYSDHLAKSYTTYWFSDLSDFIDSYNTREEMVYFRYLEQEIFFWFKDYEVIQGSDLSNSNLNILWSNGQEINLKMVE